MASIVIRNIPDDVFNRFRERARADGKSAEQLAREAIEEKAKPDRAEILRRMEAIHAQTRSIDTDTARRIMEEARAERDARPQAPALDDDR